MLVTKMIKLKIAIVRMQLPTCIFNLSFIYYCKLCMQMINVWKWICQCQFCGSNPYIQMLLLLYRIFNLYIHLQIRTRKCHCSWNLYIDYPKRKFTTGKVLLTPVAHKDSGTGIGPKGNLTWLGFNSGWIEIQMAVSFGVCLLWGWKP